MQQNEYLVAKIGFDDVDNEPSKVSLIHFYNPLSWGHYMKPRNMYDGDGVMSSVT